MAMYTIYKHNSVAVRIQLEVLEEETLTEVWDNVFVSRHYYSSRI
jgi:hypothetical protein